MINVTLTCDRCGETTAATSEATTIRVPIGSCDEIIWIIKIEKFLEHVKWDFLESGRRYSIKREESLLLCSECVEKIYSLENVCEKERAAKIKNFLESKET